MATVVLGAVGSAVGGSIGGSVLGIGAATVGQAAGAIAGGLIDQAVLGQGSRAVDSGKARSLRLQTGAEGAPINASYGRMRLAGTVIWSTRFLETVRTENRGGKATGGQRVREYSYSISLAVGLCEGPILRVGRIWADGDLLDTSGLTMRVYLGTEDQGPDPKIEAVEGAGNVPSYHGTAYLVFEDLPLGPYGNRIPQLNVEVFREAADLALGLDEAVTGVPLSASIKGVALSPGTGEWSLHPEAQRYVYAGGATAAANVANASLKPDIEVALDQLAAELPACETVSLVVSWFGDDLRCGRCTVMPKVEIAGRQSAPLAWSAAGLTTATAPLVSRDADDLPTYGGSPADASIIAAIQSLKARGYRVLIYPFLLMDVPAGNGLDDPYGVLAEQAALPWRGRITLDAAPGQPGSTDQTAAAAGEVAAFFGAATAADFDLGGSLPVFTGAANDWGWRRFVLHLAALSAKAGGVDAICVGSELRGLTQIRDGRTSFPAVEALRDLAGEVKALLPGAAVSYAADWSEYFGYRPDDGSGDVLFHLDPLWADASIDFIGIDDYMSAADWRHETGHLDAAAGAPSVYDLAYLRGNVAGGENFDWYYASAEDRAAQVRTPIHDTAHGEHWVFRAKDIAGWWSNPHHNRIGGVREATSTAWVPESKPVWLTETGCAAVDLAANQPNLFLDPKSSESALPHGSRGARDDEMQRRFLQAKLSYWADAANNPVSGVYGAPMLPTDGIYVWTWDARPWPDFPNRISAWADGPNHRVGHWLTGRVSGNGLAEVVAALCARAGILGVDVGGLYGVVHGFALEGTATAREALQTLMTVYGFDAVESGGTVRFRMRRAGPDAVLTVPGLVAGREPGEALSVVRGARGEIGQAVRLAYVDGEDDYRIAVAEAVRQDGGTGVDESSVNLSLPRSTAGSVAARWLAEAGEAQDTAHLSLPPSQLALEPGDVVAIEGEAGQWRIDRLVLGEAMELTLTRVSPAVHLPRPVAEHFGDPGAAVLPGPLSLALMDLPLADGGEGDHWLRLAASANPWPGRADLYRVEAEGSLVSILSVRRPAVTGVLVEALAAGSATHWQRGSVLVEVSETVLSSAGRLAVLNGANRIALRHPGGWEILQFRDAVLEGDHRYRLSGFLRGQRGTEALAAASLAAGAGFALLDEAVTALPGTLDALGQPVAYRAVALGDALDDDATVEATAVPTGAGLVPFAPAHLRAARAGDGAVTLRWVRRTRVGGDSWYGADVPLGEESERYAVRVRQGGVVLRTAEVTAPAYVYDAAAQAADGVTGGFEMDVAQVSAVAGPGSRRSVTIDG
ncbi:MAG: glycoside hydrolase/phage tail family protein [Pseudomonadota bacterium]